MNLRLYTCTPGTYPLHSPSTEIITLVRSALRAPPHHKVDRQAVWVPIANMEHRGTAGILNLKALDGLRNTRVDRSDIAANNARR